MTGLSSDLIPRLSAWHTLLDIDEKKELVDTKSKNQLQFVTNEVPELGADELMIKGEIIEPAPPVSLREYLAKGSKLDEKHETAVVELWNIVKNKGTMRLKTN